MKVLITGGAGYVGSVVAAYLIQNGYEVTVFDKFFHGADHLLFFTRHPNFTLKKGDIRSTDNLKTNMTGIDAIIHLAALVGDDACSVDENATWEINRDSVRTILNVAKTTTVSRFIFISTCSNYGVANSAELAVEESVLKPISLYAQSKVEAEKIVFSEDNVPVKTILRFATICGLSPKMRFDLLLSDMARNAVLGQTIEIYAPQAWRPLLHIYDAARAIGACLTADAEKINGEIFNVIGGNFQKGELSALVKKHFPKAIVKIVEKASDLRDYRVSGDKFANVLNFKPEHSIEEAFSETAAALQEGLFKNPTGTGYSAVPEKVTLLR